MLKISLPVVLKKATLTESLSHLFDCQLDVLVEKDQEFVGRDIELAFADRILSGTIIAAEQTGIEDQRLCYRLCVSHPLFKLSQLPNYRVFHNKTTSYIAQSFYPDAQFTAQKDTQHDYIMQYGESDFHFLSRLLEQEGIYYSFDNKQWILQDNSTIAQSLGSFRVAKEGTPEEKENVFKTCFKKEHLVPESWTMANYFEMSPAMQLRSHKRAVNEFPGPFQTLEHAAAYSKKNIEQKQCQKTIICGESTISTLKPGYIFQVSAHPQKELNQKYFLYHVIHHFENQRYSNTYQAIPSETHFRPEKCTKNPKIYGYHSAVVVGPQEEEVYCDHLGRIKVLFPFLEEHSCWVRVSQNWAGENFGSMIIPRVGMEVIVTFLDGDPSRPLVIGCAYHALHKPTYSPEKEPLKSSLVTSSKNELSVSDQKGKEEIYLYAQKDLTTVIEDSMSTTITQGHLRISVQKGTILIESEGAMTLKCQDTMKLSANHLELEGNKVTISAKEQCTFESHASLDLHAATTLHLKAGVDTLIEASANVTQKAGSVATVEGGVSAIVKGAVKTITA